MTALAAVPDVWCLLLRHVVEAIDTDASNLRVRGFRLRRTCDHSGVSGTGVVAHGVTLPDGSGLMWWTVPGKPSTCVLFESLDDLETIHGHGGDTRIEWTGRPPRHAWPPPPELTSGFDGAKAATP